MRKSLESTLFWQNFVRPIDFILRIEKPKAKPSFAHSFHWHFILLLSVRVGFVNLTTRLLCGWKKKLGSNSYLIWLFVSYLLEKFLLVDKRQTTKKISKHTCMDIENCSMPNCFVCVSVFLQLRKVQRGKETRKIVQFPEVSSRNFTFTNQATDIVRFVLVCACSGCNMHIPLFVLFLLSSFSFFRFYFLVNCFCASSFWNVTMSATENGNV